MAVIMPPGARRISSRMTAFNKRVFPVMWFGFLGLFLLGGMASGLSRPATMFPFLIVPLFMAVFGYLIMKKLIWDLMDEVWDNGAELIVVNADHVEHVPLTNIMNISYMGFSNPKRATLSLRNPGRWGAKLSFIPQQPFMSLSMFTVFDNEIVDDLIRRVDAARRGA